MRFHAVFEKVSGKRNSGLAKADKGGESLKMG